MISLVISIVKLLLGAVCGLALLEITLHLNPTLLLRGMALDAPVDLPVDTRFYDVYYSDADTFYWPNNRIHPVPAELNKIEAQVRFSTDEFGFPNTSPLPSKMDVVILGRSYTMGAQAANPWPRLLATNANLKVLNLAQPGSGIDVKISFLNQYGLPRNPTWIIVEVLPSKDLLGYTPPPTLLLQRLSLPVAQSLLHRFYTSGGLSPASTPVYPISVKINRATFQLTFFGPDVEALSATADLLARSTDWEYFRHKMRELIEDASANNACVALLYAPTKPEIYLSLIDDTDSLLPVLEELHTWELAPTGGLITSNAKAPNMEIMRHSSAGIRALLAQFAKASHIFFIDVTESLSNAVQNGSDPYMVYDTHWSALGHELVAQSVAKTLQSTDCH